MAAKRAIDYKVQLLAHANGTVEDGACVDPIPVWIDEPANEAMPIRNTESGSKFIREQGIDGRHYRVIRVTAEGEVVTATKTVRRLMPSK